MQFQGYDIYYSYTNRDFSPATLADFVDAMNLTETLSFGSVYRSDNAILESYDAAALKAVLTDCRDCVRVDDDQMHHPVFGVAVSVDLLGICNKSMRFTTDGYLLTNLMEKGCAFYIGEDKVQEIAAAVGVENAVPAETPDPAAIGNEELIPE